MTSCGVILTSRVSIFRCKRPTTFELCYAIFKISTTDRCCFFYEEAAITTDFSHIRSSAISCCFPIPSHFLIMSICHLTFDGSAFICAAFLVTWPLFNLSPTFQGTHEEVGALLNLAHPYMVSPFLFLNLSLYMDLPAALVNPDWDQWKIEAPQVGVRYPLVRVLFLFISFISDFISRDRTNGVCSILTSSGPTLLHS